MATDNLAPVISLLITHVADYPFLAGYRSRLYQFKMHKTQEIRLMPTRHAAEIYGRRATMYNEGITGKGLEILGFDKTVENLHAYTGPEVALDQIDFDEDTHLFVFTDPPTQMLLGAILIRPKSS